MNGHIFVSYAHGEDADYVDQMAEWLAEAGVAVWFDRDLATGERWDAVIRERVDTCAAMVVLMTPAAEASDWVAREIDRAERMDRPIIPLLRSGQVFFRLGHLQYADVRGDAVPDAATVAALRRLAATHAADFAQVGAAGHVSMRQRPVSAFTRAPVGSGMRWPRRVGIVPGAADCLRHRGIADEVQQLLADGQTVVVTQILSGLGGVGKTQIAAQIARAAWAEQSVDLLLWVSATSRDAIVSGYADAAAAVADADTSDAQAAAARFLGWLAQGHGRRWMLVLDDLTDPADLSGLWPPTAPGGRVLVTTRRRDAALQARGHLVPVGLFTPPEAQAYLGDKLDHDAVRMVDADWLAADLGYLPLALAQAATYVVDRGIDCATYRRRFADRRRSLAELVPEPGALPDEHRDTVAATWSLSVQVANALTPAGVAHPLLLLLSLLDPNGIPVSLLASAPVLTYLTSHRTGGARKAVDVDDAHDGLHCLYRLNLAAPAVNGEHPTVRVHALVQRATREHDSEKIDTAARVAADALMDTWPEMTERDTDLGQLLRSNATTLADLAGPVLCNPDAHPVLFRAGQSLADCGQVDGAIRYFGQLHADCLQVLGEDHLATLTTRRYLAYCQGDAGDAVGAVAAMEQLLADCLRVLGPDHPATLTTRHDVAYWRGDAGDAVGAVAAMEQLLTDCLRVLGPDHPATQTTRHNLACWRGDAGDAVGAVAAFEQLVTDRLRIRGPEHPATLTARHDLADWRGHTGDAVGAVAAFEQLLPDRLRVLGPHHPDTLRTRHEIAYWRGQAGDAVGAVAAFEQLLPNRLRVLGPDHPDTLRTRHEIAYWRGQAGDAVGAVAAFEQLLPNRLRVLGPDHPDTLRTRHEIAYWRGQAGDAVGAVAAFEQLLPDRLRVLGPDHPQTLHTRHDLAQWLKYVSEPRDDSNG